MKENALLFGPSFDQPSLIYRLKDELAEAAREFRADPRSYVTCALKGDGLGGARRRSSLRLGLAIGIAGYAVAFTATLVLWTIGHHLATNPEATATIRRFTPLTWAGLPPERFDGLKEEKDKSRGGGGGGDDTPTPPSDGSLPPPSLRDQVIAPSPERQLQPPLLPIAETIKVDPRMILPRDDLATGLPDGVIGPPSAGPGSDRGMGGGRGGGIGDGNGRGAFDGSDWNIGGLGSPGPGGITRPPGEAVRYDSRPVALNRPRPSYTEEARRNKLQGVIRIRALVGTSGRVERVIVVRGLPDGLNEEAIRAVYQMRFKPAMKDGSPAAAWIGLEVEFNLR